MPSLTDATQPHIAIEIHAIKEQMEVMMNALKGQVSSDLDDMVNRTDSLFTAAINSFLLSHKFRMPHIDSYDGVKDPMDHLETFKTLMKPSRGSRRNHVYKKSTVCVMSIKQREDKTLRSYITRFNKEVLSIDEADDKILVAVFINGLRKGSEEKPRKRERQEDTRQDQGQKKPRIGDRRDERHSKRPGRRFTSFTPLTTSIDQVLMQIKDEGALTFPEKLKGDPNKWSRDKYCRFHCDHGHNITDCYDLKQQIEALIRQGKLQKFVSKERADSPPQEQASQRDNERPRQPLGDIRMIVGGMAANGLSNKAR
ncbi:uncharacterized protein LOC112005039 [Quercus suber]|uniref:uncharacterized protein LOC112005039 n=1 Tax=Quercus suber TaxID=58331 RepID=UPI000CE1D501|nr:uncharacterized protein LOC112005039 [Quercus suber]